MSTEHQTKKEINQALVKIEDWEDSHEKKEERIKYWKAIRDLACCKIHHLDGWEF